ADFGGVEGAIEKHQLIEAAQQVVHEFGSAADITDAEVGAGQGDVGGDGSDQGAVGVELHLAAAGNESKMGPGIQRHGVAEIIIRDSEFGETHLATAVVLLELEFASAVAGERSARSRSILAIDPHAGGPWYSDAGGAGSEKT